MAGLPLVMPGASPGMTVEQIEGRELVVD